MNQVHTMIQENNHLRKKLSSSNKEYYEKFLVYMRLKNWVHNDKEMEELLLQILQDILSAQEDGLSAEIYFGENPKEAADEMRQSLKVDPWSIIKLFCIVFGISASLSILPALMLPAQTINFLSILSNFLISTAGVAIILTVVAVETYSASKKSTRLTPWIVGSCFIFAIFAMIASNLYMPEVWVLNPGSFISSGILWVAAAIFTFKLGTSNKELWRAAIPLVWAFALVGFLFHWTGSAPFMETTSGRWLALIPLILSFLYFQIQTYRNTKKAVRKMSDY